jgi:photosynthetic reaction center H subunit
METASFTSTFDVAELAFYAFVLFFFGLVYYLRREDKRDGYPLDSDRTAISGGRIVVQGWPAIPPPKKFLLHHDPAPKEFVRKERDLRGLLTPAEGYPGAPMVPLGDPMQDGVGPASYAERLDVPDVTFDEQLPKIVPLRAANGYYLAEEDPGSARDGCRHLRWRHRGQVRRCLGGPVRDLRPPDRGRARGRRPHRAGADHAGPRERRPAEDLRQVRHGQAARRRAPHAEPRRDHAEGGDRIAGYFAGGHMYATRDRLGPFV